MDTISQMLASLGLSERSQAVYLDLLSHGESSARQLASRLSIPRSSIYDYLRPMLDTGLVVEKDKEGKAMFVIHDVDDLDRAVAKQVESLAFMRAGFTKAKAMIACSDTPSPEPRIKFVEGKEGVLSLLYETLWEGGESIDTVWPYAEMLKIFDLDELEIFNRRRIKQNITLKSIWTGAKPAGKHIWQGVDFKVERRQAGKKYDSKMAYNIYGDKVSFFSSEREFYGFVVHSSDFATMMRAQFQVLWESSK